MSPDFEQLVGRAVLDKAFRDKLLADPEAAVKEADLTLSDDEMATLKTGVKPLTSQQLDQYFAPGTPGDWA